MIGKKQRNTAIRIRTAPPGSASNYCANLANLANLATSHVWVVQLVVRIS